MPLVAEKPVERMPRTQQKLYKKSVKLAMCAARVSTRRRMPSCAKDPAKNGSTATALEYR